MEDSEVGDSYMADSLWAQRKLVELLRKLIAEIAQEHERRAAELRRSL
jgi:hypothetical protein